VNLCHPPTDVWQYVLAYWGLLAFAAGHTKYEAVENAQIALS